jgi:hypothetical protein
LPYVDLGSTEAVVTQNLTWLSGIHHHVARCHILAGVLQCKSVQVVIKLRGAAVKPGTIMNHRIPCVFFKHV